MKLYDEIEVIDETNAHVYVVFNEGKIIQVDSGSKGDSNKIINYYNTKNLHPDYIFITHTHYDHIGGLSKVVRTFNPRVYANPLESSVIKGKSKPPGSGLLTFFFSFIKLEPVDKVYNAMEIEKEFKNVKVLNTPGHTPGSISLIVEKEGKKYVFVGDALFSKGNQLVVNKYFAKDYKQALKTAELIKSLRPIIILPGHGNAIEIK
ncbi:MAG: MBL fold metallo-hydrolase [Caldisphaera sp.]|jgi:glyoxylase-like metal-dependent hydrolase (beta-lactamase superfamily II)|nr:MBL fold metallo-hydrolase [Caldisphaera sp.]PMP60188.1 MAG: hypothetical protein C0201_03280 [Caldisphaera sp.]